MQQQSGTNELATDIRLLILDVDGVLTDGGVIYASDDTEYKRFNTQDGHGIKLLQKTGVEVAIISGRNSPIVTRRAKELGIKHCHQDCGDKIPAFKTLCKKLSLSPKQVAYAGDDWPDIPVMLACGLAIAVNNANDAVKEYAHWVTQKSGGHGAVREICEAIMQSQKNFESSLNRYLSNQ